MDDLFAREIAELFDILGQFGADGRWVLEKMLVVAVVASHVQLGAVVPSCVRYRKTIAPRLLVSVHFVIVRRGMLGRGGCRGLGAGYTCHGRPAQLQVQDSGGKEVRDGEEVQCYVDCREGAGE